MATKKKPEGKEWDILVESWYANTHEGKLCLAQTYKVTFDTMKHWISESGATRKQTNPFGNPDLSGAIREVLAIPTKTKLDFVTFDLESSELKADFSALLSAVIKPYGEKGIVFRADNYQSWKEGRRADDLELCRDITNELSQHAVVITHYGCLIPGQRVLTAQLDWTPVEELSVGQSILTFTNPTEKFSRRKWTSAQITGSVLDNKEVTRLYLSDGTTLTATNDHPWLVPSCKHRDKADAHYVWRQTSRLQTGDVMTRLLPVWEKPSTFTMGYLAGFFDGEGTINQAYNKSGYGRGHYMMQVSASQRDGEVVSLIANYLASLGFRFGVRAYDTAHPYMREITIQGGVEEQLRFLGSIHPARLVNNFDPTKLNSVKSFSKKEVLVIEKVEPLGKQPIIALGTTAGTYIAEGFGCHNTGFDIRYIRAKMMHHGLPALPPMFAVDTYHLAKANMMVSRRRLDAICKYLSLGLKSVVEGAVWVEAALNGSQKAMDEIVAHNIQDCILLEKVATVMFPYLRSLKRL